MHNPYIVGRWVCGEDHYDRQRLIEYLLQTQDTAIWVVGTRRMGKTSLLRQIELLTDNPDSPFAPLFWDLQGCSTTEDLAEELFIAVEYATIRQTLSDDEWDIRHLRSRADDVASALRHLSRTLQGKNRQLLLLVDEAEVLIEIGKMNAVWLARLRKVLQEGRQRTIIASTKLLSELTNQSRDWMTSPFLFGFHLVNLWTLKTEAAAALVRQSQGPTPVKVADDILESILRLTNRHPYLLQYLCQRLYVPDESGGYLRAVEDADLIVNHMLASFFEHDYQRLSALERRILSAVAHTGAMSREEIVQNLGVAPLPRLETVLSSLQELGHLRKAADDQWAVGNIYAERWLREQADALGNHMANGSETERGTRQDAPAERLSDPHIESVSKTLDIHTDRLAALAADAITDAGQFYSVVSTFFHEIRHLVEQDDGHKLLVSVLADGTPTLRSEEEVQIALKHWLRPMCRALNIDLDREPLTGRGFLDFKLSIGHGLRCLVEVKLFSSSRLQEGVGIQLPLYLLADRAKYGIYVPVFLNEKRYEEILHKLKELAEERSQSHGLCIGVIDIRAWKPRSASKANEVEEHDRYVYGDDT